MIRGKINPAGGRGRRAGSGEQGAEKPEFGTWDAVPTHHLLAVINYSGCWLLVY